MKIFPHILVRLGGSPFGTLDHLQCKDTTLKRIDRLIEKKEEKENKKESLCKNLLLYIQELHDNKSQNLLQNLRRDLFNEKKIKDHQVSKIRELLTRPLSQELDNYIQLISDIKELELQSQTGYEKEVVKARIVLKEIVQEEALQKGLILAAQSLLSRINQFLQKPPEGFRKKEIQTTHSLLKYLTRLHAKTSPFSTFTNLTVGQLKKLPDKLMEAETAIQTKKRITSHVRLNNYLLKYLTDLFKGYKAIYNELKLRPNPTIQNKEAHYFYLTNYNNIESFQRIPENPVTAFFLEVINTEPEGIPFKKLVKIAQENIDASTEETEAYIQQLISYGLLEFNIGVSGIDPDWDSALIKALSPLLDKGVPYISELIDVLKDLRSLAEKYEISSVEDRLSLLNEAFEAFRNMYWQMHKAAGLPEDERKSREQLAIEVRKNAEEAKELSQEEKTEGEETQTKKEEKIFTHKLDTFFALKPEQMFYEDTTSNTSINIDKAASYNLVEKLHTLLQSLPFFSLRLDEKEKMKDYFINKYGEQAKVGLLNFYEDYYREIKKPEEKKKQDKRSNKEEKEADNKQTSTTQAINERHKLIKKWKKLYQQEIGKLLTPDKEVIDLDSILFKRINKKLNISDLYENRLNFYGAFLQFFTEEKENGEKQLKAVINGSFPGYGKMTSRFLHILDDKVTQDTKNWNRELMGAEDLFIEGSDASYFNANLHPTLMPKEIWIPGGHNSLDHENQIPITNLILYIHPEKKELCLQHMISQKQAYVFDLGFQSILGRSRLFRLLESFNRSKAPLYKAAHSSGL